MVLGSVCSVRVLPLLALLLSQAKAQVGVSICACQPSVYTFEFNFSAFCDVGTVDYRDGVAGADCFVRGVGLGSENTVDMVPVQISQVSIYELDKQFRVLAHTPYVGDFRNADNITYTSVAATAQGVQQFNPNLMPGGLQLDIVGINSLEEPITNVWIILFENDCGLFPVLEVGDQVGWTIISDLKNPRNDVCPIAPIPPTQSPSHSPTQSPSASQKSPTLSPATMAPSTLANDIEDEPTFAPTTNMTVPVCIDGRGKAGGKSGGHSGKSGGKSGKSGTSSSGKSGKAGGRTLEESEHDFGGKGKGKGYRESDECLPSKKSKPKKDDSHKKIEKGGKSGKGSGSEGKAGKGGKAGGKAGKAAKKIKLDAKAKIPKLGGKSGKGKSDVVKAITFGKGKAHGKPAPSARSSYAPSRLPKKIAVPTTTRIAKLVKAPTPIDTRGGNAKPRVPTLAPWLEPFALPSSFPPSKAPASAAPTLEPTSYFASVNAHYLQSRMNHWLHEENHINSETEDRLLRQ